MSKGGPQLPSGMRHSPPPPPLPPPSPVEGRKGQALSWRRHGSGIATERQCLSYGHGRNAVHTVGDSAAAAAGGSEVGWTADARAISGGPRAPSCQSAAKAAVPPL